jgi:hypothetical protein
MQLIAEFVFCLLKFLDGLTHPAGQLGQFSRTEQHEDDQKN